MSYNEKVMSVINSLTKLTKEEKVQWMPITDYLDATRNNNLKMYVVRNNRYIYSFDSKPILDEYDSFCVTVNTGIAYVFSFTTKQDRFYVCALQPSVSSEIVPLTDEFRQPDELKVLMQEIKNAQKSTEAFLDSIIKLSNEG